MVEDKCTDSSCQCHVAAPGLPEADQTCRKDRIRISGMDCADCAQKLETSLKALPEVEGVELNFATGVLTIEHKGGMKKIMKAIDMAGYRAAVEGARTDEFEIAGLDCYDCAVKLEKYVAGMPGVSSARMNFASALLTVEHTTSVEKIGKAISGSGYTYKVLSAPQEEKFLVKHRRTISAVVSGIGLAVGMAASFLGLPWYVPIAAFAFAIVAGGFYIFRSALYSARTLTPDMNLLMTIAVAGAILISQWEEAAAVIFLFSVGYALQSYTLDRTRNSIKSLIGLTPNEATVLRDNVQVKVPAKDVQPGETIVIKPGERIALDGVVTSGTSTVNQAPITGESLPEAKMRGSEVYAGTLNEHGTLEVRVTSSHEDNTLTRIVHMVEEAQGRKAPAQEFVDRFARYYTPAVLIIALAIATLPAALFSQPFDTWFYRALILLVIACPCALVISTPVSIVAAIGNASRHGLLIKGGTYLEECSRIKAIAFDKTGTLTEGRPEVVEISTFGCTKEEAIRIAAAIEQRSEHPLASAIIRANGHGGMLSLTRVESFESMPGLGVSAQVNGIKYDLGGSRMFQPMPANAQVENERLQAQGMTTVLLKGPQGIMAIFGIMDRVRGNSEAAVKDLHKAGISRLVMLTGDSESTARAIAGRTGVDEFYAGLLPQDKVSRITQLKQKYGRVAMVGDGVNDAPALAEANIGIAMGATGSDTAIETADIALMSNDLTRLSYLIELGRRTMGVIWQNVTFSLLIKVAFVALTLVGLSNLWMAMFADTGAAIIVILNGMRLLR